MVVVAVVAFVSARARMSFAPIENIGFVQRTLVKASPIPVRRLRGVDLANYRKSELDELLRAGPLGSPSALLVEQRIQDARGGVLPKNWTVVKHYKNNVDRMSSMQLGTS